ncbi:hypothetical protein OJAV_G00165920 [Oryzias javanicus]|uniref:Uncharacterized protein n=1 Tax=Oryzias javanicus TaxID=123683 RepID=A0A3S2P074_ORYJA|nr:hypothetical protein OJAV_G00165920 [Oryzias javanicus]
MEDTLSWRGNTAELLKQAQQTLRTLAQRKALQKGKYRCDSRVNPQRGGKSAQQGRVLCYAVSFGSGCSTELGKTQPERDLDLSWMHSVTGQDPSSYNLTVKYATQWGDWGIKEMCPTGFYASGFSIRVERSQGSGDDTALNGIRLLCVDPQNHRDKFTIQSTVGRWGEWTDMKRCETGYLASYMLRVEPPQGGGDDTSVNNIKFLCSGHGAQLEGDGMEWGEWGTWSNKCPKGAICGLQTRVEAPQVIRLIRRNEEAVMEESNLLKKRLQAITEKHRIQEDIRHKKLELDEMKLRLQHMKLSEHARRETELHNEKKKTLRDQWLQQDSAQQQLLLQDQQQTKALQLSIYRTELEVASLEREESMILTDESFILNRLKAVEKRPEDIIKEVLSRLSPDLLQVHNVTTHVPDVRSLPGDKHSDPSTPSRTPFDMMISSAPPEELNPLTGLEDSDGGRRNLHAFHNQQVLLQQTLFQ